MFTFTVQNGRPLLIQRHVVWLDSANFVLKMGENIQFHDYVVIQRQDFCKIVQLTPKNREIRLGQDTVDLSNVVGEPFWSAFRMIPKPNCKKIFMLSKESGTERCSEKILSNVVSGSDNRDINDDGAAQKLSCSDIMRLKEKGASPETILGTIVENSATFASKTEYSQEKYLKKKEKKHSDFIMIKRPTLRIIAECIIGKGPSKALGLRMDTLSQLTTIACVRSGGCYMLYETGCQGLVSATLMNAIGPAGTIIHIHPGNIPEKHALLQLNLSPERMDQILCVSIFNLVRKIKPIQEPNEDIAAHGKRKADENPLAPEKKRPRWEEREEKALSVVRERKIDGLVVVSKEHPGNILKRLLKHLEPSRPFVVFFAVREPLQQLFLELKTRSDVTAVRLTENWLRSYQVLPDRTHPDINMSGSSGFLLSGVKVDA